MASLNKVQIIGHCGKAPDMRYMPNGDAVATISVATSENWKDKDSGEKKEHTEWHRVTCFGRLAEVCGEYLKKGSQVYFEGSLRTRKWQDKDGQDRYTTEIRADRMLMLGGRREAEERAEPTRSEPGVRKQSKADDLDDDVPF